MLQITISLTICQNKPDELNLCQLGCNTNFNAIQLNDLFLFKLHGLLKYIVGGEFLL